MEVRLKEINGKEYEIQKQGVSECLKIRSASLRMLLNSGVSLDKDIMPEEFGNIMIMGMHGDLVYQVKEIILTCIPAIKPEKYEQLDYKTVMTLFLEIYNFHVGEADKKKEQQKTSSNTGK